MFFTQQRKIGVPFSEMMLQMKAISVNKKLGGPDNFYASKGWLWGFKKRYGIRNLKVSGGKDQQM